MLRELVKPDVWRDEWQRTNELSEAQVASQNWDAWQEKVWGNEDDEASQ